MRTNPPDVPALRMRAALSTKLTMDSNSNGIFETCIAVVRIAGCHAPRPACSRAGHAPEQVTLAAPRLACEESISCRQVSLSTTNPLAHALFMHPRWSCIQSAHDSEPVVVFSRILIGWPREQ